MSVEVNLKWPTTLTIVRHDTSLFNELKEVGNCDPIYQAFVREYEKDYCSLASRELAFSLIGRFSLEMGDHNTPLAKNAGWQSKAMAKKLRGLIDLPDIVFVSPYVRTLKTLEWMIEGWPELKKVETQEEERLMEQSHGLATVYNDWRIFNVLFPLQKIYRDKEGPYHYQYPQGESIPDVRARNRSMLITLSREFSGRNVLLITHHVNILATRANLERLGVAEFIHLDQEDKPINCGVTIYRGLSGAGRNKQGRLILDRYNMKLY